MYVRKTDKSLPSSTPSTSPSEQPVNTGYTALAIKPTSKPGHYEVVEIRMSANDEVISVAHSSPLEYHLAVQMQKARGSFVWTGLIK
jgi:hypothetical protein